MPPHGSRVLDRQSREDLGDYDGMKNELGTVKGEEKVFDTWMDSSNSNLFVSGYLNHPEVFKKAFPTALRPQGKEIVQNVAVLHTSQIHLGARSTRFPARMD